MYAMSNPSLDEQLRWSRIVHEKLYKLCWHEWEPYCDTAANEERLWICHKCKAEQTMWIGPPPGYPHFDHPPASGINYCTTPIGKPNWALAMSALQEMLRRESNGQLSEEAPDVLGHLIEIVVDPRTQPGELPEPAVDTYEALRDMTPADIIRAIVETLEGEDHNV